MNIKKKEILAWCGRFFLGNVLFLWLLALKYLPALPWFHTDYLRAQGRLILAVYVLLTYLSQFALLALLPLLIFIPLTLFYPQRRLIISLAVLVAGLLASLVVTDSIVYSLYRFHLNGVILDLWFSGIHEQFFDFSGLEYLFSLLMVVAVFLLEGLLAYYAWRKGKGTFSALVKATTLGLGLALYISYTMTIFSAGTPMAQMLIETARVFPLYTEILGSLLPVKNGREKIDNAFELNLVQPEQASSTLNYPLHPLIFTKPQKPLNVVMIVIDTWRFDMLKKDVTPGIEQFSKRAWVFKHHLSGGNATGPGIFSLFYGLPSTYWTTMENHHRGPLVLDELLKRHYQMKILASAGLKLPAFDRTVFQALDHLDLHLLGQNPYERDLQVTTRFKDFINKELKPDNPFFSFLFYDSAHSYCALHNNLGPYRPVTPICNRIDLENDTNPLPYLNRYKNALLLVDHEVKQVLAILEEKKLLKNTVVIITGDHGEEFNDNHLGYWGHGSNFTRYQVQTPMIVYWPGEQPKHFEQRSTHFDVAPLLMTKLLGCQSLPQIYSVGSSLTSKTPLSLLITSYVSMGILQQDRITTIFPSGHFQISSLTGQPLPEAHLNSQDMERMLKDMRQFYENDAVK